MFSSKNLAVMILLGTVAFVSNGFLPTPFDKMFIVIQALSFALGSLVIRKFGGTYVSLVNGILLSIFRSGFFPFSLLFSLFYGLFIDGAFYVFKVHQLGKLKTQRLVTSLALVTAVTGVASMFVTTTMGLLPWATIMYLGVIVVGIVNGLVAGYLTTIIWNRRLGRLVSAQD